jgi:peptidoglycan-associated lipoprotein
MMALGLPLAVGACAKPQQCAARPSPPVAVTRTITKTETALAPTAAPVKPVKEVELTSVEVSEEIARVCALPDSSFAFDSAEIGGAAAVALDKLASCFAEGELAGRHLKIVGHADPRGTEEYNLALGQRRASAVGNYLMTKGISEARIETTSVGEYEARGNDEAGWARDRRVEILLGDEAVILPKRVGSPPEGI